MNRIAAIIILSLVIIAGCKKEDEITNIPAIELISASPSPVQEFTDLTIRISYKDGDGDLGENAAGVKNCFVRDSRNGVVYSFRINQLAPSDEAIIIQGQLDITVENVPIIQSGAATETVTYDVYVIDRSGNQSNTISTQPINVTK